MKLTVGPHPPAVYWRRRAMLAAPVLIVVLLLLTMCSTSDSGTSSSRPRSGTAARSTARAGECTTDRPCVAGSGSGQPLTIDESTPSSGGPAEDGATVPETGSATSKDSGAAVTTIPGPSAALLPTCRDADLTLVALVDKPTYPVGTQPRFKLAITNVSHAACVRDVGSREQELVVTAGPMRVWSSDDCSPSRTVDVQPLQPAEKRIYGLRWSARSSQPGCPKTRKLVGAGSFQLVARLGSLRSRPLPFSITG